MKKLLLILALAFGLKASAQTYSFDKATVYVDVNDTTKKAVLNIAGEMKFYRDSGYYKVSVFFFKSLTYSIFTIQDDCILQKIDRNRDIKFCSAIDEMDPDNVSIMSFLRVNGELNSLGVNDGASLIIFVLKKL